MKMTINGRVIEVPDGKNVEIRDDRILVDGKPYEAKGMKDVTTILIEGDVGSIHTDRNVECRNVTGEIQAAGNVMCDMVDGSITAGGNVSCDKVNGDIHAKGNVSCEDVQGSVRAGGNISHS